MYFFTTKDIGVFLRIKPDQLSAMKPIEMTQKSKAQGDVKIVTLKPVDDNTIEFLYAETKSDKTQTSISIKVDSNELLVMQKMVEYSVPYIYGWQHLMQPHEAADNPKTNIP